MSTPSERIHVVVTCHNAHAFVEKSLRSIARQSWRNLSVAVVDDASTDRTAEHTRDAIGDDVRFRLQVLDQRVWQAKAQQIAFASLDARPQEIVVLVDGDDWLLSEDALAIIHQLHHERRLLAAYGNYITTDGEVCPWSQDYPLKAKITGTYRSVGWLAAHPKSFRYGLLRHVHESALTDSNGTYFRTAGDHALFLPILELAGTRTGFWKQPLYVYNRANPLNEDKLYPRDQRRDALEVLAKPPYSPLPREVQEHLLLSAPAST